VENDKLGISRDYEQLDTDLLRRHFTAGKAEEFNWIPE
jgi:hypothetical protein